ncbi:flavin oxidoreductase [Sphaerisporangium melleum]|uniref:Flavin oxidoreductase n=1 Tax=Sphaerisporangium melleum TaxID=321316 RepID=A0A917VF62_9ACTN|nr:flavin reductase family protein [Sphaerisporangium melleum]GGK71317.1 flavin oxidoreductase [Sphaerisporangium melleum]GII70190.1 flavin oxidoreductase [Sphaerisporangium melleum]
MNEFVEAMRQLAAGVVVVTVQDERDDIGTTVTTFTSLSTDPPMVLLSLASSGYLCEVLLRQDRWAATLLSGGQAVVASRFATPGRPSARLLLAGTPHHRGPDTGAFVIDGGVAALEAETARVIPGGDHTLFLAQVVNVDYVTASLPPLVRMRGRYRAVT